VDPNVLEETTGDTPLHHLILIYNKSTERAQAILQKLANYNANLNL